MATINLPFAASAARRAPTSDELANGFSCGDADKQLFDWLMWWETAQVARAIAGAGLAVDDADMDRLARAIQIGSNYAVATGTANAWVVDLPVAPLAYGLGLPLDLVAPATNSSTTVNANVEGLGDKRIKKRDGTDPAIGDLVAGVIYPTRFDGTNIRIMAPLPSDYTLSLASSHGPTGYQQLPGGLYIQWGLVDPVAAAALTTVTFPIAFPTAAYQVLLTDRSDVVGNTDQVSVRTTGFSASGFTIVNDESPTSVSWFAIGK